MHYTAHFGLVELSAFFLELGVRCSVPVTPFVPVSTSGTSNSLRTDVLDLAADDMGPESTDSVFGTNGRKSRCVILPSSLPPGRMLRRSLKEMEQFERDKDAKLGHLEIVTRPGQNPEAGSAGGFSVVVGFRVVPRSKDEISSDEDEDTEW